MTTYADKITQLIELRNVRALIEKVANRPSAAEEEVDPQIGDAYREAKNFLNDHLNEVLWYLSEDDPKQRYLTVRALGELRNPDSIEPLVQQLVYEKDEDVAEKITSLLASQGEEGKEKGLPWIEARRGQEKSLYDAIRRCKGGRLKYFYEVAAAIQDQNIRLNILKLLGTRQCKITGADCNENLVVNDRTYFIGYDFKKWTVRNEIESFFKKLYGLEAILPERRYSNRVLLCHICTVMQTARFCVFDLSRNQSSKYPNSNVMIELGMALILGRPCIILLRKGTKVISDLRGPLYIEYKRPAEISVELGNQDLTDIVG